MADLNKLLKEMGDEIPGLIATGVVGMDGLPIAVYSPQDFEADVASAQFSLVMKLVQKSCSQLGNEEVEDNLVTTNNVYLLTRFLGDGSYFLGITADKNAASLGNVRLIARQYADALWKGIPRRK